MKTKDINEMSLDELKGKWVEAYKIETKAHAIRVCLEIYIHRKENEAQRN